MVGGLTSQCPPVSELAQASGVSPSAATGSTSSSRLPRSTVDAKNVGQTRFI